MLMIPQGVALIKSCYGVIVMRDPTYFLFAGYGIMYFMALLPSKLFAMFTVSITVSLQSSHWHFRSADVPITADVGY